MEYPYDTPTLETSLAALLGAMRARKPTPKPNTTMTDLAAELSSAPLAAFVHSMATHIWLDDLGKFETTIEALDDSYDEAREALGEVGLGDAEGVIIGMDGGGEEMLILVAEDSDAGYAVYRFAIDGMAYDNGKTLKRLGTIAEMATEFAKEGEITTDLSAAAGAG